MPKKKGFVLPTLVALAGFAWSYRKAGQRQRVTAAALRPGQRGTTSKPGRSKKATGGSGRVSKPASPADAAGRHATVPEQIPLRGWYSIAKRTAEKFSENELMSEAASVTFFALLSLFPAITAVVSIYGLFADPSNINAHLDTLSGFVPGGGMDIIRDQIKRLTESPTSGLGLGAAFGILAAIWSANQGAKAMLSALNDVYGEKESRGFVKLTLISLAFTVGSVVALLISLGLLLVLPMVFAAIGFAGGLDIALKIGRWPTMLVGLVVALAVLYRFGPSRHRAQWRWVTWGGVIGAVAWIGLSFAFSWYVTHFGNYNKTYGSLGAAIGFMTWIWLSSTVLLLGAQINAEMEAQTAQDTTTGPARPPGARKAAAADAVSS